MRGFVSLPMSGLRELPAPMHVQRRRVTAVAVQWAKKGQNPVQPLLVVPDNQPRDHQETDAQTHTEERPGSSRGVVPGNPPVLERHHLVLAL